MVLGGGTIADLIPREQRGTAMAVWMMGPTIGVSSLPLGLRNCCINTDSKSSAMCRSYHRRLPYRREGLEMELLVRRYSSKLTFVSVLSRDTNLSRPAHSLSCPSS